MVEDDDDVRDCMSTNSEWMQQADVNPRGEVLTIIGARKVKKDWNNDGVYRPKVVMKFDTKDRELVLNKTNMETVIDLFDSYKMSDWLDNTIEVYVDPSVQYAGRRTGGIRLRAPREPSRNSRESDYEEEEPPRRPSRPGRR